MRKKSDKQILKQVEEILLQLDQSKTVLATRRVGTRTAKILLSKIKDTYTINGVGIKRFRELLRNDVKNGVTQFELRN